MSTENCRQKNVDGKTSKSKCRQKNNVDIANGRHEQMSTNTNVDSTKYRKSLNDYRDVDIWKKKKIELIKKFIYI
jgi:hypothetical protein